MRIKIDRNRLKDSPFCDGDDGFVFSDSKVIELAQDIVMGLPSSFLITGYRGTGKSSFIQKLEVVVKEIQDKNDVVQRLFVRINVTKKLNHEIILRKIIRALFLNVQESFDFEKENKEYKIPFEDFNEIFLRTFYDVTNKKVEINAEKSVSEFKFEASIKTVVKSFAALLGIPLVFVLLGKNGGSYLVSILLAGFGMLELFNLKKSLFKSSENREEKASSQMYDDEIAEYKLIEILEKFEQLFIPVFVLDELDKIENDVDVRNMLDELKPIMLSGRAFFIIVGGQNMFFSYEYSKESDDSALSSLFSRSEYVRLMSRKQMREIIYNVAGVSDKQLNISEVIPDAAIDYLVINSKRVPRNLIHIIRNKLYSNESGDAYLDCLKLAENIQLYSVLNTALDNVEESELKPSSYPAGVYDYLATILLRIVHFVVRTNGRSFNNSEIEASLRNDNNNSFASSLDKTVSSLSQTLIQELITLEILKESPKGKAKVFNLVKVLDDNFIERLENKGVDDFNRFIDVVRAYAINFTNDKVNIEVDSWIRFAIDLLVNLNVLPDNHSINANEDNLGDLIERMELLRQSESKQEFYNYQRRIDRSYLSFNAMTQSVMSLMVKAIVQFELPDYKLRSSKEIEAPESGASFQFDIHGELKNCSDLLFDVKVRDRVDNQLFDDIEMIHEQVNFQEEEGGLCPIIIVCVAVRNYSQADSSVLENSEAILRQIVGDDFVRFHLQIIGLNQGDLVTQSLKTVKYRMLESVLFLRNPFKDFGKKNMLIGSNFLQSETGSVSAWVHMKPIDDYLNRELKHEYLIAHATNNYNGQGLNYENAFGISLSSEYSNNQDPKRQRIFWRLFVSNNRREGHVFKGDYMLSSESRWVHLFVRWNLSMSTLEFMIDGRTVEATTKFKEFWPTQFEDYVKIGVWGDDKKIHGLKDDVWRLFTSANYLDNYWVNRELGNRPEN